MAATRRGEIRAGVLLAAIAALAAAGASCGRKGTGDKPVVRFWHIQVSGPTVEVVERCVGRVQERHPEVVIESVGFQNDAYKTKLNLAMSGDSPPDVFHTWGGGALEEFVSAGKVMELPAEEAKTPWNRSALGFCECRRPGRAGGEKGLYALPADITAVVFWYNTELFEMRGFSPPRTEPELKDLCLRLKESELTPIALGNSDKWPGCFFFIYFAARLGGLEPFAARRYDDPSFVAAGDRVAEMVKLDVFTRGANGVNYDGARREFLSGRAAMILMGSWILSHARAEAPEFVGKMDCFAFPAVEGGKGSAATVVGGMNAGYAVSSACRNREAALDLIRELTGAQAAREWAATGRVPARTDADLSGADRPTRSLIAILNSADAVQLYYDQALPPALAVVHKETIQAIFAGEMSGGEAAKRMAEAALREGGAK